MLMFLFTIFKKFIGDVIELSYIVTSGAAIIGTGEETITVGETDLMSEFIGLADVIKFEGDLSLDGAKRVLSKHIIKINRPLTDEARVASKIKLLVIILITILYTLIPRCKSFLACPKPS